MLNYMVQVNIQFSLQQGHIEHKSPALTSRVSFLGIYGL